MNPAHLHIVLNHFPVIAVICGVIVLAIGHFRKNSDVTMAALVLFVLTAVVALPTFLTGRPANQVLRGMPGIVREVTTAHRTAALPTLWVGIVLGIMSLWGLYQWRKTGELSTLVRRLVWVLALVTTGMLAWTSLLGGEVRHTEARPDFVVPTMDPNGPGGPGGPGGAVPGGAPDSGGGQGAPSGDSGAAGGQPALGSAPTP